MTQPSRTTETINRDNAAIRDIMLQIRELTVPDRATLALGLIGHLATMMNRSQMAKLMDQLQEEAERVQDVPPSRQRDDERGDAREGISSEKSHAEAGNAGGPDRAAAGERAERKAESTGSAGSGSTGSRSAESGAAGRAGGRTDERVTFGRPEPGHEAGTKRHGDVLESHIVGNAATGSGDSVGQAGRGEFRSGRLL